MEIFSILANKGIPTETWNFKDKQGTSVFGDAKVMDIGYENSGSVVSSPIEEGSFFSYNKTGEPQRIGCTLAFEGTSQYLQSMLNITKKYKESMDVFSIVTPFSEYENMTLESYSYTFDVTNGYGVLYVRIICVEIKEVAVSYSSTDVSELPPPINDGDATNPSDASTQDTGMANPTTGDSKTQESANKSALKIGKDKAMERIGRTGRGGGGSFGNG